MKNAKLKLLESGVTRLTVDIDAVEMAAIERITETPAEVILATLDQASKKSSEALYVEAMIHVEAEHAAGRKVPLTIGEGAAARVMDWHINHKHYAGDAKQRRETREAAQKAAEDKRIADLEAEAERIRKEQEVEAAKKKEAERLESEQQGEADAQEGVALNDEAAGLEAD